LSAVAIQIAKRIALNPKIQGAIGGAAIGFGDAIRQMLFPDEVSMTVPPQKQGRRANVYQPSSRTGASGTYAQPTEQGLISPSSRLQQKHRQRPRHRGAKRNQKHRCCC